MATFAIIIGSCTRTTHHTALSPSSSSISGLTSIHLSFDTNTVALKQLTWTFTGTNPITASTVSYSDNEQLIFTGSNVTQLIYTPTSVSGATIDAITINVTYNSSNQIDTLTLYHTTSTSLLGNEKYAFQYSGGQITKVILAHQYTSSSTYDWVLPTIYYFTYAGSNISRICESINYQTSGHDTNTYSYFINSVNNNFAGSLPTYFLLNYLESRDDVFHYFPMYINPNLPDSVQTIDKYGNIGNDAFKTFIDTSGRITVRIHAYNTPYPDTTVFYY